MANDVVRSDSFKTGLSIRGVHSDAISKRKTPSELRVYFHFHLVFPLTNDL